MSEMKDKVQTRGTATFRGIIGGLNNIRDGKSKFGLTSTDKMKKMQFSIKTSEFNIHYVDIMQFKGGKYGQTVMIGRKNPDSGDYEKAEIDWNMRALDLPDGWKLSTFGNIAVKTKGDDKYKTLVPEDAIDSILENFTDGDSVMVICDIRHSESNGKLYTNMSALRIGTVDEVKFDAKDFEEAADFSETVVYRGMSSNENGITIECLSVSYNETKTNVTYVVEPEDMSVVQGLELVNAQPGDVIEFVGIINNRGEYEYVEDTTEQTTPSNYYGRKTKSYEYNTRAKKTKVIKWEKKNYQAYGFDEASIKRGAALYIISPPDLNAVTTPQDDDDLPF